MQQIPTDRDDLQPPLDSIHTSINASNRSMTAQPGTDRRPFASELRIIGDSTQGGMLNQDSLIDGADLFNLDDK